ncbi:hypothetical protein OAE25_02835, partial [Verrucomicrobiales bacterium]|nr:hypothetical protein [Verrucomicrobiales bacterium]
QLSQTTFALVGTQNVSTTIVAADQINLPIAVASALIYDFWTMLNANPVRDLKPSTTTRFASVMTRLRFFFKRCQLRFNSRLTVLCDVPMVSAMSSCFSPRCFIR